MEGLVNHKSKPLVKFPRIFKVCYLIIRKGDLGRVGLLTQADFFLPQWNRNGWKFFVDIPRKIL